MTEEEELLTPDDAADLVEELLPAKIRSRQLGLALKIPRRVVANIHRKFSKPRDQLFHLFIEFTNLSELRPTWSVIVDALRTNEVYLPELADKVEAAHIRQPISTSFEGTAEGSEPSGPSDVDKVKSEPSTQFKISDDRPDEPHITEEAFFRGDILFSWDIKMRYLEEPLKDYGILDETSFHVLRSVWGCRRTLFYLDQMHYLMYILGKRENGLQILLKETQHRFPEHWMIIWLLQSEAYRMEGSTSSTPGHARKEMPHDDEVSLPTHCDATTTTSKSTLTKSDRRDDEPQIAEEVFFLEMVPVWRVNVEVLVPELKKHGILLDESIMSSLKSHRDRIDELHYVMYRLGKKENGLQIFYRCLRETQKKCLHHRLFADKIESEAHSITSRRKSAKADPAETETAPSRIPAPSSPVESQQSSVSQGAHLPSPSSTAEPEETVVYTGEACSYFSQNGISFHFPASESKCRVELRFKVVNDDYVLPKGYEDMPLVSSMFKITTSDELPVPVTVQMEHCAIIEEDDSLVHMIAHGPPPYHFKLLPEGKFPLGECYGEIEMKMFCTLTQAQKRRGSMSLSVHIFYHSYCSATFIATRNLRTLNRAVKKKYVDAIKVVEQSISCNHSIEAITLRIPRPKPQGWFVQPEFEPPKIETRLIREYREGKIPPCIHLSMTWTGEGMPVEEKVKIAVGGTSVKSFFLSCRPACASDSNLSLSHRAGQPLSLPSHLNSHSLPPTLLASPTHPLHSTLPLLNILAHLTSSRHKPLPPINLL